MLDRYAWISPGTVIDVLDVATDMPRSARKEVGIPDFL